MAELNRNILRLKNPLATGGVVGNDLGTGGGVAGNPGIPPGASQGMFYSPNARMPGQFDFSYLYGGLDALSGTPRYKKTTYSPFQFGQQNVGNVGGPQGIGEGFYNGLESSLNKSNLRPLVAQADERMRQLNQGFGGPMSDATSKELQLKNSMKLGEDIAGVQSNVKGQIANQKIQEQRDISNARFGENQRVRDLQLQTNLDQAGRQSDENFRAAGFGDASARNESQDLLSRIQAMINGGAQIPQIQGGLQNQTAQAYFNILQNMGGLTGLGGM